jgi:UPF0271 protein
MIAVDLNADMGEGFGPWRLGDDAGLLAVVTSANIACGFHAGDPQVMAAAMRAAAAHGVGIGAHPGFADLQGFGRRRIAMTPTEVAHLVAYQLGAAEALARLAGARVRHLKLHGALANMAAEDEGLAHAAFAAARAVAPGLALLVMAGTAQERAARALGPPVAAEAFADRAYAADGTLLDRARPGAVITDPAEAAARAVRMVTTGRIPLAGGGTLAARIDSLCVHGDTPGAVALARAVREALEGAGVTVRAFPSGTG